MKAQVISKFGDTTVFEQRELPTPRPGKGEVLIRVQATSVNPVDYKIRSGELAAIAPAFPAILHGDVAGIVEGVGEGVTRFTVGDAVYGCVGGVKGTSGALCELMVAEEALLAKAPRSLSLRECAALPLISITAWDGLIDRAGLKAGQSVLVLGGTGGVGHVAIQIAKARGARVFATGSSQEKLAQLSRLGADFTFNHREHKLVQRLLEANGGTGFDIVFDGSNVGLMGDSLELAVPGGQIISILSSASTDLALAHYKGLTIHYVLMLLPMLTGQRKARHGEILSEIAQICERQLLAPILDPEVFPLENVGAAHAYAQSGRAQGKVVISIAQ